MLSLSFRFRLSLRTSARFVTIFTQYEPSQEIRRKIESKLTGFAKDLEKEGYDIRDIKFPLNRVHTKGHGFVEIPSLDEEGSAKIIEKYDGTKLDDETNLVVQTTASTNSLYIGVKVDEDLSRKDHEDKVQEVFSKYGNVEKISVLRIKGLGQPLGYAFVEYENEEDAQKAIKELDGTIGWRKFRLSVSMKDNQPRVYQPKPQVEETTSSSETSSSSSETTSSSSEPAKEESSSSSNQEGQDGGDYQRSPSQARPYQPRQQSLEQGQYQPRPYQTRYQQRQSQEMGQDQPRPYQPRQYQTRYQQRQNQALGQPKSTLSLYDTPQTETSSTEENASKDTQNEGNSSDSQKEKSQ